MVALGNIKEWQPHQGPVTTWTVSPAARAAVRTARRNDMAPTYQRAQHLRAAHEGRETGKEVPRLMVVAWDIPGVCDTGSMTAAINAHVRRHDSYHDWFGFENGEIVRRTIDDPEIIDFECAEFGPMNAEQIRAHALTTTPGTLDWGGFTFGIIQHGDYFTFYASVDHLYIDGMSAGLIFFDIHLAYGSLRQVLDQPQPTAAAPIASYRGYAARQHERLAGLTLSSPEITKWIDFVKGAGGHWPSFPLPLGHTEGSTQGEFVTVEVLDAVQTESFDTACQAAGARFSGGVLACAALAEHYLTGTETYYGFTPYDTRKPGVDSLTVGWFASLVPVTVPVADGSFPHAARAAQASFDTAKELAGVPFERVLELTTPAELGIELGARSELMVSFLDLRKIPLADLFEQTHWGTYGDNLSHGGANIWINRHADKTTVTISAPDNPVARASVQRYIAALQAAFARVVKSTTDWVDAVANHANCGHSRPSVSL
jgi:Condensation domain